MLINSKTRYLLNFFYEFISAFEKFQWKLRYLLLKINFFALIKIFLHVQLFVISILFYLNLICHFNSLSSSIQFSSGFIPINGGGYIYPILTAISLTPNLHLTRFKASSFSKPTLLLSFSTCVFHVFFMYLFNLNIFVRSLFRFLVHCVASVCVYINKPHTFSH